MATPILETIGLKKYFKTPRGMLHAVDDVNFRIEQGRTLGVVGESGCGKTTLGRTIIRLTEPTEGKVLFHGKDICQAKGHDLHEFRKKAQIIFQDPSSSLNPRMSVGSLIAEPIKVMKTIQGKKNIEEQVFRLMQTVGLDDGSTSPIPMSWTAAAGSASAWPGRWPSTPSLSSATSRSPRWTCPSRRRFSTFSWTCRTRWA